MSDILPLAAEARPATGKGAARAARRSGFVPCVIYGGDTEPEAASVTAREVERLIGTGKFMSTLFMLDIAGKKTRVIPRDVQFHPLTDRPLHVDFLRLAKDATIAVEVPVHFLNEERSPGLKAGGVLNIVRHVVELLCPADKIPDAVEVDLLEAELGDTIHISNVKLDDGVTPTITDRDFTIATIAAPSGLKSEKSAEDEEEEGGEEEGGEGEES